jgi:hypothetical protein
MTTAAEIEQPIVPGRDALGSWEPDWCICHGEEIHAGEDKEIVLTLEEPWHGRCALTGREKWEPATLTVALAMDLDAVVPTYEFVIEPDKCFEMTGGEVEDLISALFRLWSDAERGQRSASARLGVTEQRAGVTPLADRAEDGTSADQETRRLTEEALEDFRRLGLKLRVIHARLGGFEPQPPAP